MEPVCAYGGDSPVALVVTILQMPSSSLGGRRLFLSVFARQVIERDRVRDRSVLAEVTPHLEGRSALAGDAFGYDEMTLLATNAQDTPFRFPSPHTTSFVCTCHNITSLRLSSLYALSG